MDVNIKVDQVRSISTRCTQLSDEIRNSASALAQQIGALDDAFPGMPVGMRTKFEEWGKMSRQLSEALQQSRAYFDGVIQKAEEIETMLRNMQ